MGVFSILDLITAHRWSRALFTTYSLSLSFFESVVLDALVRQQVSNTFILSDIDGIRASLSEYGARSAGRLYDIEPVAVEGGCFHPKLVVLASETQAHVVVGSGNITFGGWGSNLECVDHIHAGFAADAVEDVAGFLESVANTRRVKHSAGKTCSTVADQLRTIAAGGVRTGQLRVIHNLERSLLDQLDEMAADLGGARRLAIVSPFFDDSAANELRIRLKLQNASLHVHDAGAVAGSTGLSWPTRHCDRMVPVTAGWCNETSPRLLHAKVFEILCSRGRIVVSGSANATTAAWGFNRNVELCVVRLHRSAEAAWQLIHAVRPIPQRQTIEDDSQEDRIEGVLRATITSGQVNGSVVTPFPSGDVRVFRVSAAGEVSVGSTIIDVDGHFTFRAGDLEIQAWSNERFLLRVVSSSGDSATGFVMFTDLSDIRTRVGPASGSFFALLAGAETPNDVAAIMDWFHQHPTSLALTNSFARRASVESSGSEATIEVATLLEFNAVEMPDSQILASTGGPAWRHFMEGVLQCFHESRGPFTVQIEASRPTDIESNRESDLDDETATSTLPNEEKDKPLKAFERLFDAMLNAPASKVDVGLAFRITQYICDRLEPDLPLVSRYLNRLVEAFTQHPPHPSDREIASAAVLLWATHLNIQSEVSLARVTRSVLLRLGVDVKGAIPHMNFVQGFARLFGTSSDFDVLWANVCRNLTPQEEVRAYHLDTGKELAEADYPFLSSTPEWHSLKDAGNRGIQIMARYSEVCPFCFNRLPTSSAARLRASAITGHCGKILLCEEVL